MVKFQQVNGRAVWIDPASVSAVTEEKPTTEPSEMQTCIIHTDGGSVSVLQDAASVVKQLGR